MNQAQNKVTSSVADTVASMTKLLGLDTIAEVNDKVQKFWLDYIKLAHKVRLNGQYMEELAVLPRALDADVRITREQVG